MAPLEATYVQTARPSSEYHSTELLIALQATTETGSIPDLDLDTTTPLLHNVQAPAKAIEYSVEPIINDKKPASISALRVEQANLKQAEQLPVISFVLPQPAHEHAPSQPTPTPPVAELPQPLPIENGSRTELVLPVTPNLVETTSTIEASLEALPPDQTIGHTEAEAIGEEPPTPLMLELADVLLPPVLELTDRHYIANQEAEMPMTSLQQVLTERLPHLEPEQTEKALTVMAEISDLITTLREVSVLELTPKLLVQAHGQILELCSQIYEICGIELSEADIEEVINNILKLACDPDATASLAHPLEDTGTHEVKSSLSRFLGTAHNAEQSLLHGLGKLVLYRITPSSSLLQSA